MNFKFPPATPKNTIIVSTITIAICLGIIYTITRPSSTKISNTTDITPTPTTSIDNQKNISSLRHYLVGIDNGKLYLTDTTTNDFLLISPAQETVIKYITTNDIVFYETGIVSNQSNHFYLYYLDTQKNIPVDLSLAKPINTYSLSPDGTSLAILGHYQSSGGKVNVLIYNFSKRSQQTVQSSIFANYVNWLNPDTLIIGTSIDKKEPNFHFSLYSLSRNDFPLTQVYSHPKSLYIQPNLLYYYNYKSNSLNLLTLNNNSTTITDIPLVSNLSTAPYVVGTTEPNTVYLILPASNTVNVAVFSPPDNKIIKNKNLQLNPPYIFVEPIIIDNSLHLKLYNRDTKQIEIKPVSL